MYSRIAKVVSGMVFGTGQEVVFQLLSAFLWIKAWGAPLYGEWLMISLVPILLLRGNAGVFHAATSDLIRYRQGDDKVRFGQALADLIRSERLFLVAMALLYGSMAATASFLDSFAYFSIGDLWIAAGLFFLQFLLYQRQQSILCLAKAGQRAPEAIIWQNQFRLAFIVAMLALPALLEPILCLTAAVAAQLAVAISTAARFHALISEASELRAASSGSNALDMTRNGLLYSMFPLGHTAVHTLSVWAVGAFFSPVAGAAFHNMRTIARIPVLLAKAGEMGVRLELSSLFAKQGAGARRLFSNAVAWTAALCLLVLAGLLLAGEGIYGLMTHGELEFYPTAFFLLCASACVHALSQIYLGVAFSINRQSRLARPYFAVLALLLLLIAPTAQNGLIALATTILAAEIGMLLVARITATSLLPATRTS